MPLDVDRLAEATLAGTQALIAKALAPLVSANEALAARNAGLEARLAALEAREIPEAIDPAAIGALQDGLAAAVAAIGAREEPDVAGMVQEAVSAAVAGLRPPEVPDVAPLVAEAVAALPRQPNAEELKEMFRALLESHADPETAALRAEVAAVRAAIPEAGKPGVGVCEARMNADGELIIKLTNGETFNVGKVRGADGMGFEDMSVEWDGERTLKLVFAREGRTEVTSMTLPTIIDRGVWREGAYERGDGVTWGGSFFIAQRDTTDKPETSDAWRLSVKRGRDGKDHREPPAGGPVKVGVPR